MTSPPCWSTSSKSHPARSTATLTATRARRSERRATDPAPHGRVAPAHCGRKSRGPVIAVGRRRDLSHAGKRAYHEGGLCQGFSGGFREGTGRGHAGGQRDPCLRRHRDRLVAPHGRANPERGRTTSEASGYVLTVFHRSPSGKWLLARDANLVAGDSKSDPRLQFGCGNHNCNPP